jgi:hypothetical protein
MGVDVMTYRLRIGTFMSSRIGCNINNVCDINDNNYLIHVRSQLQLVICIIFISLLVCGDIEANPGPNSCKRCSVCGIVQKEYPELSFFKFPADRLVIKHYSFLIKFAFYCVLASVRIKFIWNTFKLKSCANKSVIFKFWIVYNTVILN